MDRVLSKPLRRSWRGLSCAAAREKILVERATPSFRPYGFRTGSKKAGEKRHEGHANACAEHPPSWSDRIGEIEIGREHARGIDARGETIIAGFDQSRRKPGQRREHEEMDEIQRNPALRRRRSAHQQDEDAGQKRDFERIDLHFHEFVQQAQHCHQIDARVQQIPTRRRRARWMLKSFEVSPKTTRPSVAMVPTVR